MNDSGRTIGVFSTYTLELFKLSGVDPAAVLKRSAVLFDRLVFHRKAPLSESIQIGVHQNGSLPGFAGPRLSENILLARKNSLISFC